MANDIWIFPLEPLDGRYTKQWFEEIPRLLTEKLEGTNAKVENAIGRQRSRSTTTGAFLDFTDTNSWKSTQLADFVTAIHNGEVSDTAEILFTDFWNPAILQVAYMRDLMDKSWTIHGIAHAGAYDPTDILGLKMRKPWPHEAERAFFYASDYTYFGTEFHRDMFLRNLDIPKEFHSRAVVSGQPHGAIIEHMKSIEVPASKTNQVIWPHRYNEDKQPEIVEDIKNQGFDVTITQQMNLTKDEFYKTLADTKVLFSCSLHENLGISVMEGVLLDVLPLVPDRCSYSEMYLNEFKYPSIWTESYDNYMAYRPQLLGYIQMMIDNYDSYADVLQRQKAILKENYLSADAMISKLIK